MVVIPECWDVSVFIMVESVINVDSESPCGGVCWDGAVNWGDFYIIDCSESVVV